MSVVEATGAMPTLTTSKRLAVMAAAGTGSKTGVVGAELPSDGGTPTLLLRAAAAGTYVGVW